MACRSPTARARANGRQMNRKNAHLDEIAALVERGRRVSLEQGLWLLGNADLFDLGRLAAVRRRAINGDRAYYTVNLHINVSNLCENRCRFCAFRRDAGQDGAYELTAEQVWDYAERNAPQGVKEFHLVAGLSPNLHLDYFERVLRGLGERFPGVHLKAFTAVEIAHLAGLGGLEIDDALRRLMAAGLGSLTGGGAETLSPRVRALVCPEKLDGEGYLDVHRRAHRLGLRSTATLLFGHVETAEERLAHLCKLRELQDETKGFTAFVPLVFHPANTELAHLTRASGRAVLEMIALSRIMLDNFDHIKAYWVSLGPKLAQIALAWGADDLDGTVGGERIHHSAGAESPDRLTREALRRLISEAGFKPVERDALYANAECDTGNAEEENHRAANHSPLFTPHSPLPTPHSPLPTPRLSPEQAEQLLAGGDLLELGRAAHAMRLRLHPEPCVTYVVDRNINTTNQCESLCAFCAFGRKVGAPDGYVLDRAAIAAKIDELFALGGRQILMQGGLHPELGLAWHEDLFRWMRARWPSLHIHALSPPEIKHLAERAGLGWAETIARLRDAGLDSIPGGGAEILCDRLRSALSPRKCSADEWIGVMRAAHREGLRTTATMVIGLGETLRERVEHFERVHSLQDEALANGLGGFTAFIPWTFQPRNTALAKSETATTQSYGAGAWDYLRTLAVARLYLDNIANVQASWVTQGRDIAQIALLFGANDLGSTMIEENVVAAAGTRFRMSSADLETLAADLGLRAARRDFFYRRVSEKD